MRKPAALAVLLIIAAAFVAAACGGDDEEDTNGSGNGSESGAVTVEADDFYFKPTTLTAKPGQALTIKVQNEGKAEHTFTIDDLGVNEEIPAGQEKTVTVESASSGSFEFYCRYHHSKMSGTVTVGAAGAAPTATATGGGGYSY